MTAKACRLVVLDRDGVINRESPDFIRSPAEWIPLPGAMDAIARLTRSGFAVVVASNQSGVGRGLFTAETLVAIHRRMTGCIEAAGGRLAGIFVCPHAPDADCDCRKPRPGLMRQVEAAFHCPLAGHPAIGDSERDLLAAQAVGARAILVRTGNGMETEARLLARGAKLEVYDDLAAAAGVLCGELP
ncbi:D-glycero-D-manno-heptose 1,7-bisphosphate phosphatase [Gammaproteobacteria bacterium]|nr:D-glycero-D-manno-heptose 1,7-bisphosphate phosphatase [Gammaproteobacteria bacterium]